MSRISIDPGIGPPGGKARAQSNHFHEEAQRPRAICSERCPRIPKVTEVTVRPPYGLNLTFDDGVVREVDLAEELWGAMFEPLKDPRFFAEVRVDHGTVVWPSGLDLDPVVLHGDAEPAEAKPQAG